MSTIPGYEGPAHPLSSPIEALTAVSTADFNHRAVGIRSSEDAFHLASTIIGGCDIVEEFVATRIWSISYGWAPIEIAHFNVNWAAKQVPFPKFGIKLREGQSAEDFMLEIERRVTLMISEYTMNEYKAYKALVKHKRKINRVFSEVCGDKSFPSRRPGRKLKIPVVVVATAQSLPPKPREEDLPKAALQLPTRLRPLVSYLRGQSLSNCQNASVDLLNKFLTPNSRRPPALLRLAERKPRMLLRRLSLLKFGGFPPLSTTTSSRSPARKVLSFGPC
jgi:hypothetical protein